LPKLTNEDVIRELEGCEGRFATVCFLDTNNSFSGKVMMVHRHNGAIEIAISPVPSNTWSRQHPPVRIPVGDGDIRMAHSEDFLTVVYTWTMIVHLKEMCSDDLGRSSQ